MLHNCFILFHVDARADDISLLARLYLPHKGLLTRGRIASRLVPVKVQPSAAIFHSSGAFLPDYRLTL